MVLPSCTKHLPLSLPACNGLVSFGSRIATSLHVQMHFPAVSDTKSAMKELVDRFTWNLEADKVFTRDNGLPALATAGDCFAFHGVTDVARRWTGCPRRSRAACCHSSSDCSFLAFGLLHDYCRRLPDYIQHELGLRQHWDMAAVGFEGCCSHAFCDEAF